MSDQSIVGVDDIRLSVLAQLDLRDYVLDEFQIDFGDTHAGIAPRPGQCQCHVRLRGVAKIDRPVILSMLEGLDKPRVSRKIALRVNDVRVDARDPQALDAQRIDLCELCYCWDLAQQPQGIYATLLQRGLDPRELCGPAELGLDLLHELTNFG